MPYSSFHFVHFKWWFMSGLDAAIWVCQKQFYEPGQRSQLTAQVGQLNELQWSAMLMKILQTGHPDILTRLQNGRENLWITDLHLAQCQRSGSIPAIFPGSVQHVLAGIAIKKVNGNDRPLIQQADTAIDIIITLCPPSKMCPTPVLHRQQIPQWSPRQRQEFGRSTTGPLFTHWDKI